MTAQPDAIHDAPAVDAATLLAARRFLALVGERYPVREAYLFGSRARHPPAGQRRGRRRGAVR